MGDIILKLDVKPLNWMTVTTNLKIDYNERTGGNYRDSKTSYQNLGLNYASMQKNSSFEYTWNGIINIDKTFKENHKIMGTAVIEAIQEKKEWDRSRISKHSCSIYGLSLSSIRNSQ